MRNRSVVFVIRDKKILMEKLCYEGRTFYSIPGGGIEDGETPEQTAIRELKEECGLDGVIIRKLAEVYNHERTEYSFWVSVPKEQEAIKGYDPEEPVDDQPIKEVRWMNLNEMSEKDRAFEDVNMHIKHITQATYYRLKLPGLLLDIDKCLYLDVDIVVQNDLTELYEQDMEEYYIAGGKAAGLKGCHLPFCLFQRRDLCR